MRKVTQRYKMKKKSTENLQTDLYRPDKLKKNFGNSAES